MKFKYNFFSLAALLSLSFISKTALSSDAIPPTTVLIDQKLLSELHGYLKKDIVVRAVQDQNIRHKDVDPAHVLSLDKKWRAERKQDEKPMISGKLSNPLSSFLTRIQAHSTGLYTEIFIMDDKGLNVGQSNITSDFWQGDEGKWQKTFLQGPEAVFIDSPEFNEETKTWRAQANLTIPDPISGSAIGAATFEINLTELERRRKA